MNKILNIKKNKVIRENLSYQNFININFMRKTIIIIYIISFFFSFFQSNFTNVFLLFYKYS